MEKESPDRLARLTQIRETSLRNPPSLRETKQNFWAKDVSALDNQTEYPLQKKKVIDRSGARRHRKIKARSRSGTFGTEDFRVGEAKGDLRSIRSNSLTKINRKDRESKIAHKIENEATSFKHLYDKKTHFWLVGLAILAVLIIVMGFPWAYRQSAQQIPVTVPSLGKSGAPSQSVFNDPTPSPFPSFTRFHMDSLSASAAPGMVGSIKVSAGNGIIVHVTGCVKKPGVVVIPLGSRVVDAVNLAGGANEQANPSAINMARKLVDGEHVHLPSVQDKAPVDPQSNGGGNSTNSSSNGNLVINLNQATSAQIEELPGIGPALAKRILDYRQAKGNFSSVDELNKVAGIGPSLLSRLRPHLTV